MLHKLLQEVRRQKKLSLYIQLPPTNDIHLERLLEFIAIIGVQSTELDFDLFKMNNQLLALHIEKGDETNSFIQDGKYVLTYKTIEELEQYISSYLSVYSSKAQSPLEKVDYKSIADLWSQTGTGIKDEAHPSQHLDVTIIRPVLHSREAFESIAYFLLRLGLYSTSVQLPMFGRDDAHLKVEFAQASEPKLSLKQSNKLLIESPDEMVSTILNQVSSWKHYLDGGFIGKWEKPEKREDKAPAQTFDWKSTSEAERIEKALMQLKDKHDVIIYMTASETVRQSFRRELQQKFPHLNIAAVRSSFKPAYYWLLEEILPTINRPIEQIEIRCQNGGLPNHLELKNRWVMELHPVDEMIALQYGIKEENVTFEIMDNQASTYEVWIDDVCIAQFTPIYHSFPYLGLEQYVCPTTSGIQVDGEKIIIPSDRELFYRYLTEEVVPHILQHCEIVNGSGVIQPIFNRLDIHFTSHGIEEPLPINEEINSSFEALYEDIYFNILHLCKLYGEREYRIPFTAPGGVVPHMHVNEDYLDEAYGKIELYGWEPVQLQQRVARSIVFDSFGNPTKVDLVTALEDEFEQWFLLEESAKERFSNYGAHVKEYIADYSYLGNPIAYLEVTEPIEATYYSALKKSVDKHTILIEAGHHPNEVSSTPAITELIQHIVGSEPHLLEKVNIVAIPMANVDGRLLLDQLTKVHPKWKHHAARFNAVGLEFAHVKFQKSIFGEANVLPLLLKKWAPDIVIDNHGIPAHEWVQPYAGYNSPPLFPISYNLPVAKVYGIGRYIDTPWQAIHKQNGKFLANAINKAFDHTPFAKENAYRRERFEKYGTRWLPEKYPIENEGNLNFYLDRVVTPEYPTVSIFRYPSWISADIISEAADEVVYGDELQSCMEAQKIFNLAIIHSTALVEGEILNYKWHKKRPIQYEVKE